MKAADLSSWSSLVFWVRGDGQRHQVIFFLASTGDEAHIQSIFANSEWTEHRFDFRKFGGTLGTDVKGIFVGPSSPGPFRLELDAVELR